jgi:hypothetical protein
VGLFQTFESGFVDLDLEMAVEMCFPLAHAVGYGAVCTTIVGPNQFEGLGQYRFEVFSRKIYEMLHMYERCKYKIWSIFEVKMKASKSGQVR